MQKYITKNLHKKLIYAGILVTPRCKDRLSLTNNYIDFNYKDISFVNLNKYTIQFYEIFRFLKLATQRSLKIMYIYGVKTPLTQHLQFLAQITNANYFTGKWINGFFTNRLFLTSANLFFNKNETQFSCSVKPHIAIVFWSINVDSILDELHKSGIITILIGAQTSKKYPPTYYLPGNDLTIKNYLFYFTLFTTLFQSKFDVSKIAQFNYKSLFSS